MLSEAISFTTATTTFASFLLLTFFAWLATSQWDRYARKWWIKLVSETQTKPNVNQPTKHYSRTFLWYVACFMEFIFSILLFIGIDLEPPITKYTVNVFSRSVIFDITQTKKHQVRKLNNLDLLKFIKIIRHTLRHLVHSLLLLFYKLE